jgi:serine/threonine-protein kinase
VSTTLVGNSVGRFRVDRRIGKGGMGAVYAAFDEKLEREVALKMLLENATDPLQRKRFLREARLAAKLTHPNIATVFEVDELEGQVFIVMELLEGKSLRRTMADRRLSGDEAIAIARDIARALARAHNAGIVHRDIKPENVFLTEPSPGSMIAKVLDFGLAREKPRGEEHTATDTAAGGTWGTPGYLSPEQAHGKPVDARSDIFSFGAVFYEMLAGRRAFRADNNFGLLLAVAKSDPEPLRWHAPEISDEVYAIVIRCMAKDKEARFADGNELAAALESAVKGGTNASIKSASVPLSSSPHMLEASAGDHAEAATTRTSSPALVSAGPVETSPRDEIPTFERQRRERFGMGVAIASGLGVAIVLILVVSSVFSGSPDPSPAASWAPPPAPPDPITIPTVAAASAAPSESAQVAVVASGSASAHPGAPPPQLRRHTKNADCAQPFVIDSKGVRIPKLHCL